MTVNVTQIKNRISANVDMGAKMKKYNGILLHVFAKIVNI